MPVEEGSGGLFCEVSIADIVWVEDKASLFVSNVRSSRGIRCDGVASLSSVEIFNPCYRLESTTYSSLSSDQRNLFSFHIPFGVLQAHAIDLFIQC
jgi:hypothetical protein